MRILYFDIDTLRADHLGCYGYHRDTSPYLDRVAARGGRAAVALAGAALWLAACSRLVDPEALVIKCEPVAGVAEDPCAAAGMHCVEGVCRECGGEREDCNGVDDDCDGFIDEGHDLDGDGYTWCGGGIRELADCVPSDPAIHPSGLLVIDGERTGFVVEVCDGKDNDCDQQIDEEQSCARPGSCVDVPCEGDLLCNTATGQCIATVPVGSDCSSDSACQGGFCLSSRTLGSMTSRCATACCVDADCGEQEVCSVLAGGLRACLPQDIAGRGSSRLGAECRDHDACASGLCVGGECRTRCSDAGGCGEQSCKLSPGPLGSPQVFACVATSNRGDPGDLCTEFDPTACKSGLCLDNSCARPCGATADCDADQVCGFTDVNTIVPPANSRVSVCLPAAMSEDALCCTSADCGAGSICKPREMSSRWDMVCQPN